MAQHSVDRSADADLAIHNGATLIDEAFVREHTYVIRGQKVMLDRDLAAIYGYETRYLNLQVKNNSAKFDGEDFMFQLTEEEFRNLMLNFSTSSWGGSRKLPFAFTEQGIYMLMTVLKGDLATQQSRALVRTFKKMKDYIIDHQSLLSERDYVQLSMSVAENAQEIIKLNARHRELDDKVADVVNRLGETVTQSEISQIMMDFGNEFVRHGYGFFDGRFLPGDLAYEELYASAKESVIVVDNYIGLKTLVLMAHAHDGVSLTLVSDNVRKGLSRLEYEDFLKDYHDKRIEFIRTMGRVHDRFIALDFGSENERIYHCGASSKDVGLKASVIQLMRDNELSHGFIEGLFANPRLELK